MMCVNRIKIHDENIQLKTFYIHSELKDIMQYGICQIMNKFFVLIIKSDMSDIMPIHSG